MSLSKREQKIKSTYLEYGLVQVNPALKKLVTMMAHWCEILETVNGGST
ncbi:MAG TPA: hypothetical protein VE944_02480 [Nostoc sp.]|nr:hypothetical protein [Nostoc sp.]HYX13232.1 hypothetical protein [Nostoc sp.]